MSADSLNDASIGLFAITTTEFVSTLVIASKSLNYLHSLITGLQAEAKDIVQAIKEVDTLKKIISDIRDDVETQYRGQFFEEVEKMCQSVGTQPSKHTAQMYQHSALKSFIDTLLPYPSSITSSLR